MAAGTKDPVKGADEVVAFAKEYGVPVAIKAAFGGGGRGMKVAHTIEEIPELFESATREAIAASGRGECFVAPIGRASGRERVCQYVCISGVAVYLKIHTKSTDRQSQQTT